MRTNPLYVLLISILPLMICSGMVYSILALYISDFGATKTHIGLIFMVGAAAGAFLAPVFGKLSDKIGRRPVLIFSTAIFMVAFFLYSIIGSFVHAFPIQAFEGFAWASMGVTVTAYVADIAPEEKRGWAMGMYERTWFIGWLVGPALGGFLADTIGFRLTFIVGSTLIAFGLLMMIMYVKEPKKLEKKDTTIEQIKQKLDKLEKMSPEDVRQLMKQIETVCKLRAKLKS
ncbi:MAG: MFS transporter [Candidatus Bathyarchaeota archaeon]